MYMIRNIIVIVFFFIIQNQFVNAQSYKIDIIKADSVEVEMGLLTDSIKTVNLRLPADIILQGVRVVQLTNSGRFLIVAGVYQGLYLFDIKGNFIKEVITPASDYQSQEEALAQNGEFDALNNIFYQDAYDKWIGINIHTGRIVDRIIKPHAYAEKIANFCQVAEDCYIGYVNNQSGKEPVLFIFFKKNGDLLSFVPNHRSYVKHTNDNPYNYGTFYKYNSKYYCFEPSYGSTVYEIKGTQVVPYIWFNLGTKTPVYNYRDMPDNNIGRYYIFKVIETQSRIHFQGIAGDRPLWGYYDKRNDKTYLISNVKSSMNTGYLDQANYIPFLSKSNMSITYMMKDQDIKVLISILK